MGWDNYIIYRKEVTVIHTYIFTIYVYIHYKYTITFTHKTNKIKSIMQKNGEPEKTEGCIPEVNFFWLSFGW